MSDEECMRTFVGRSAASALDTIAERLGGPVPAGFAADWDALLFGEFGRGVVPVAGVVAALDALQAAGVPTCVASSGTHEKIRFTLGLTGLYERFAGRIFSVGDVARGKPAPDLFLHAAGRMGVPPAQCAVVEDSRYGVEAARAAGMRAFGYAGGLAPKGALAGPQTIVFEDMRELPGLLARG
jgi:HAD superfamily hydrolase (TIGR01509 family)